MLENDRWSVHLEYLKLTVTLATGILALAVAVYSDGAKIPADGSRYVLLGCAGAVLLTLVLATLGITALGNHLLHWEDPGSGPTINQAIADRNKVRANKVLWRSGGAFFLLVFSGALLAVFFGFRTLSSTPITVDKITQAATAFVATQVTPNETATLRTIDVKGDDYQIVFSVSPGTKSLVTLYGGRTAALISFKVVP